MPAKNPNRVLKSPKLGLAIQQRVKEMKTNPRRVSAAIGYAYDHFRKVHNGDEFPGKAFLVDICNYLKLDYNKMLELRDQDKAAIKGWVAPSEKADKVLEKLQNLWHLLSRADKLMVLEIAELKASKTSKS